MTPDQGEVVSAFVDGVAVDPNRLAQALADPDALALLVTCARVRAEISADERRPSLAFYDRMDAVFKPRGIRRWLGARAAVVAWPLAAGAATAMLMVGLWVGFWVLGSAGVSVPPAVTVVAPATPGPAPPVEPARVTPASDVDRMAAPPAGPPRPTEILRFGRPGEWREGVPASGGTS